MTTSYSAVLTWLWITSLLTFSSSAASAKKLAKVQAGLDYKENDEVHIIVNSVG
jgi:hypothetical protein